MYQKWRHSYVVTFLSSVSIVLALISISAVSVAATEKPSKIVHLSVIRNKEVQTISADVGQRDFGALSQLAPALLTQTFTVRNDTRTPLIVDHLQTSCGCTVAAFAGEEGQEPKVKLLSPGALASHGRVSARQMEEKVRRQARPLVSARR